MSETYIKLFLRMRALLSVPVLTRSCLRRVAYRQEMPPPGGYPDMPWRRNIPQRGYGFIACLVCGFSTYLTTIFLIKINSASFQFFLISILVAYQTSQLHIKRARAALWEGVVCQKLYHLNHSETVLH